MKKRNKVFSKSLIIVLAAASLSLTIIIFFFAAENFIPIYPRLGSQRLIDGVLVKEGKENPALWAVVIDNFVMALPPAGLEKARLVIEAPAEAAIPRLLAFYNLGSNVDKIGPVRSARPYFIDWAKEYQAALVHVGGSPAAIEELKKWRIFHLDQFYLDQYFWRGQDRKAPFNVYTSTELLEKNHKEYNWPRVSDFTPWPYKDDLFFEARPKEQEIIVPHTDPVYKTTWRYDRDSNVYLRYQNGDQYLTENGEPAAIKNLIIQFTDIEIIDRIGRREIKTNGEGEVLIFRDGRKYGGIWRTIDGRTRFFDEDGKEIALNRGLTWIRILPAGTNLNY